MNAEEIRKFLDFFKNKLYQRIKKNVEFPKNLMIEPINTCNLNCPLCITGTGNLNRKKKAMSLVSFKKIIDECKNRINRLYLYHYGEPFLHKDILKMGSYATTAGMSVYISTNGTLIEDYEHAKKVVRSGIENITISLDGADEKIYLKYRKGSDFKKVIDTIKHLVRAKKELKINYPNITIQTLIMAHNEHQRNKIRKLVYSLGVDNYYEKPISLPNKNSKNFQEMAKKYLPKDKLISKYQKNKGLYGFAGDLINYCPNIFNNKLMLILVDGSVIPCCYDERSKYILGNVFKTSVREVWNGNKFKRFRKKILNKQKSIDICDSCVFSRKVNFKAKYEVFKRINKNSSIS